MADENQRFIIKLRRVVKILDTSVKLQLSPSKPPWQENRHCVFYANRRARLSLRAIAAQNKKEEEEKMKN